MSSSPPAGAALTILVTIVLPSEYAIDPTGIVRLLGLTKMGEIKAQLAVEAAADARADAAILAGQSQFPALRSIGGPFDFPTLYRGSSP